MKQIKLLAVVLLSLTLLTSLSAATKRYDVKSGIVKYKIDGGGSMLGITTKIEGVSKLYFTDYGNLELHDETETTTTMGRKTTTHNIVKIVGDTVYSVDDKDRVIVKQRLGRLVDQNKEGKDLTVMGREMMKEMGGKKIGTEKFLGYPCEVWELLGSKIWIYKGIPLKIESNFMGFKHTIVATEAKFGVHVPKEKFKLPDYPVKSIDELFESIPEEKTSPASRKNSPSPQMPSPQELQKMQEMMQNLGKMFGQQ
jgi:hypothetical protein